jgi:hypothetical protein
MADTVFSQATCIEDRDSVSWPTWVLLLDSDQGDFISTSCLVTRELVPPSHMLTWTWTISLDDWLQDSPKMPAAMVWIWNVS